MLFVQIVRSLLPSLVVFAQLREALIFAGLDLLERRKKSERLLLGSGENEIKCKAVFHALYSVTCLALPT